jgi:hypothetical protein
MKAAAATTFPVEQVGPKSEEDLPSLSNGLIDAMWTIRDGGGVFHRFSNGDWLPPNGGGMSKEKRQAWRLTDRRISALIRNGYLMVTNERAGRAVRVTLTFP